MVNNFFVALENVCRRRDFYWGWSSNQVKFYQLAEGYLEKFATLSRQAQQAHSLLSPMPRTHHSSGLIVGAHLLNRTVIDGLAQLEKNDFTEILPQLGTLQHLAAAIINATDDGLYLAASLYNKQYSYDSYREFSKYLDDIPYAINKIFDECLQISESLTSIAPQVTVQGFCGTQFKYYDVYRCAMNRLYVVINMIIALLQRTGIDAIELSNTLHSSHLSQRWSVDCKQRNEYLASIGYSSKDVVFYPLADGENYLCYDLLEQQLLFPPTYSQPKVAPLAEAFKAHCVASLAVSQSQEVMIKSKENSSKSKSKAVRKGFFLRQTFVGRKP